MKLLKNFTKLKQKVKRQVKRIKKFNKRIVKSQKSSLSIVSKLISVILVLIVTPVNVFGADAISQSIESVKEEDFENTLHLDAQSQIPVKFDGTKVAEIVSGESKYQRKQREESEAKSRKIASRMVVSRDSVSTRSVSYSADPGLAEKRALAQKAASAYGIDWKILEAVWQVESGKSWDTKVRSYAGAQGPMQFMPGTWRAYKQDGNGDGVSDVYNAEDALYGAANYLAANGAATNVDRALFAYNHAQWYVNKVKAVANSI